MKSILIYIVVTVGMLATAQETTTSFNNAKEAYERGDYSESIKWLKSCESTLGYHTPKTQSMLAMSYAHLKDWVNAGIATGTYFKIVPQSAKVTTAHEDMIALKSSIDGELKAMNESYQKSIEKERDAAAEKAIARQKQAEQAKIKSITSANEDKIYKLYSNSNNPASVNEFASLYPGSSHVDEIKAWTTAQKTATMKAYVDFYETYPSSVHYKEAKKKAANLDPLSEFKKNTGNNFYIGMDGDKFKELAIQKINLFSTSNSYLIEGRQNIKFPPNDRNEKSLIFQEYSGYDTRWWVDDFPYIYRYFGNAGTIQSLSYKYNKKANLLRQDLRNLLIHLAEGSISVPNTNDTKLAGIELNADNKIKKIVYLCRFHDSYIREQEHSNIFTFKFGTPKIFHSVSSRSRNRDNYGYGIDFDGYGNYTTGLHMEFQGPNGIKLTTHYKKETIRQDNSGSYKTTDLYLFIIIEDS